MEARFDAQLQTGDVAVTAEDVALLRAIDREGSLNAATDRLGRSFSRAHGRLDDLEGAVGQLVDRQRGGSEGGGSELTERARELLAQFTRLQATLSGTVGREEVTLVGEVTGEDGELAVVETAVGTVRALLFEEARSVQVTVPADAVTLQDPADAPAENKTSARNRFEGRVTTIDRQKAIARVEVAVDSGSLLALVTLDSLERLGLEQGSDIVASFKATAARATPRYE